MKEKPKPKCEKCGVETQELYEDLKSCKFLCKDCRSGLYKKYDVKSSNTKEFVPKVFK